MRMIKHTSPRLAHILCGSALALVASLSGWATDVQFTLTPRETWIGSPSVMRIVVRDGATISQPTLPRVQGLDFEVQPGRSSRNSMNIVNGTITGESMTTISVLITPSVAGLFTVPPISIDVDGQTYSSAATTLSSALSTTGDLLRVEVTGDRPEVWIGQPLGITLKIFVKPFRSTEHKVTLGEADMWQFIDQERCDFGPFTAAIRELAQRGQRPLGHEELVDGVSYFTFDLRGSILPAKSGVPTFDDVRIAWNYPTQLSVTRGLFGGNGLSVSATKPISAVPPTVTFSVTPLPLEGQPASFQGAVGSFTLSATAKPLRVAVGDPITLTLAITDASTDANKGEGLAQLHPPLLTTPELLAHFRMPSAPLAGTVTGNQKVFTQTLRPTRPGITAIPPIPFSWFDTTTGTYRTAQTDPISIDVTASDHISTDAILGVDTLADSSRQKRTATAEGFLANVNPSLSMVRSQSSAFGWAVATGALIVPPLLCGGVLLARRRARRFAGDAGAARESAASATASQRLARGECALAIAGYIADRMRLPGLSLTRREAATALQQAGACDDLREEIDSLLVAAERARFDTAGPTVSAKATTASERDEARNCIRALERLEWRSARNARKEPS